MKYFIGHLLEGEAKDYYDKITTDLSNKFDIKNLSEYIPPHFTFKPPFEFEDEESLKEEIKNITESLENFDFMIDDFGSFDFESRTIYIKPKDVESIQNKLENIVSYTNKIGDKNIKAWNPFKLHASIARYLDDEKFEEIWSYLQKTEKPSMKCSFNNLTLFVKDNDVWRAREIFRF